MRQPQPGPTEGGMGVLGQELCQRWPLRGWGSTGTGEGPVTQMQGGLHFRGTRGRQGWRLVRWLCICPGGRLEN